jgi:hypothetical protein
MKEAIREIILSGGTIKYPYKTDPKAWMDDVRIFFSSCGGYSIISNKNTQQFGDDLDTAIQVFGNTVYSKTNLGNIYYGIEKHQMLPDGWELDDISEEELAKLADCYMKEFYEQDFAFFHEFDKK